METPPEEHTLNSEQAFELAIRLHQGGRYKDAENLYRGLLDTNPNHLEVLHLLGALQYLLGKHEEGNDLMLRALAIKPDVMLLDEPSMGLAPQLVEEIFEIIKKLNEQEGVSMLLAEQNTNIALKYAKYGYILENGRVVIDGVASELRENEDVKEFYLGGGDEERKSFKNLKSYKRRKRWL